MVQHSDRLLMIKVKATPADVVFIQVYMPTSASHEEEVERLYEELEDIIKEQSGKDYVVVMGD